MRKNTKFKKEKEVTLIYSESATSYLKMDLLFFCFSSLLNQGVFKQNLSWQEIILPYLPCHIIVKTIFSHNQLIITLG